MNKESNILVHEGTTKTDTKELEQQWQTLVELAKILGFEAQPEVDSNTKGLSDRAIDDLVQQRNEARKNKNYGESDRIRDELQAKGITLIDKPGGVTIWNRD